jgi:hypothetical protein
MTAFLAQALLPWLTPFAIHAGVESFEVVWQENKVVANGDFDVEALVAKLNKSGKETSLA